MSTSISDFGPKQSLPDQNERPETVVICLSQRLKTLKADAWASAGVRQKTTFYVKFRTAALCANSEIEFSDVKFLASAFGGYPKNPKPLSF